MGTVKRTKKFALVKRVIGKRDARLKENQQKQAAEVKKADKTELVREMYVLPLQFFSRIKCNANATL